MRSLDTVHATNLLLYVVFHHSAPQRTTPVRKGLIAVLWQVYIHVFRNQIPSLIIHAQVG